MKYQNFLKDFRPNMIFSYEKSVKTLNVRIISSKYSNGPKDYLL